VSYTERLADAFAFADMLHRRQRRKGSDVPYITHLMSVAALVGEYGGTEDQVIAALLHDAVEDQGGPDTLSKIRERFGEGVAHYVEAASDASGEPRPPWLQRKQTFLSGLRTAPADAKLIVAADKLHNVRTLIRDYYQVAELLWDRFTGKRDGTLWYYREALVALAEGWDHPIVRELREAVETLEGLVAGTPSRD
jgi:(p)ppGpp synthase/HD superfamily hydrolase